MLFGACKHSSGTILAGARQKLSNRSRSQICGRKTGIFIMEENRKKRNDLLAEKIIKGLQSRNMSGFYVQTRQEALDKALELIPEGSVVAHGGSKSMEEIGLLDALRSGNYQYVDRSGSSENKKKAELAAYDADFFLGSTNAITEDGILVNIDGNSNRVSAYAYGPKHVLLIVGMNKVTADVDMAVKRARNEAAVINAQRFGLSTPCTSTGSCMNCKSPDTICCQFLVTRYSRHKDRIFVILVDEALGF